MKKYVLALIGFFTLLFSFNIFANPVYEKTYCTVFLMDSLDIYHGNDVLRIYPSRQEPGDSYVEIPGASVYTISWEGYLECVKQAGDATEAETQEHMDLQQDYDKERYQKVQGNQAEEELVQTEVIYTGCEVHLEFYGNNKSKWLTAIQNFCPFY